MVALKPWSSWVFEGKIKWIKPFLCDLSRLQFCMVGYRIFHHSGELSLNSQELQTQNQASSIPSWSCPVPEGGIQGFSPALSVFSCCSVPSSGWDLLPASSWMDELTFGAIKHSLIERSSDSPVITQVSPFSLFKEWQSMSFLPACWNFCGPGLIKNKH